MVCVALGLGSNRGDRSATLRSARERLAERSDFEVNALSAFLENPAVGGEPGQGNYKNAALVGRTSLSAEELLDVLLDLERDHGRDRKFEGKNGARTLDLDLLIYGDELIESSRLTVPHPRMLERSFVLLPLAEVAPAMLHPRTRRSIATEAAVFAGSKAGLIGQSARGASAS